MNRPMDPSLREAIEVDDADATLRCLMAEHEIAPYSAITLACRLKHKAALLALLRYTRVELEVEGDRVVVSIQTAFHYYDRTFVDMLMHELYMDYWPGGPRPDDHRHGQTELPNVAYLISIIHAEWPDDSDTMQEALEAAVFWHDPKAVEAALHAGANPDTPKYSQGSLNMLEYEVARPAWVSPKEEKDIDDAIKDARTVELFEESGRADLRWALPRFVAHHPVADPMRAPYERVLAAIIKNVRSKPGSDAVFRDAAASAMLAGNSSLAWRMAGCAEAAGDSQAVRYLQDAETPDGLQALSVLYPAFKRRRV